jgi:hypothetical protein
VDWSGKGSQGETLSGVQTKCQAYRSNYNDESEIITVENKAKSEIEM